ncbi:MAG: glycine--tRNA ligase subunit beta [Gammaproteobacteria bacterium]|nr:glycine--tRNA ligase subunit beta [Gammaproteobacteria bacterium]
MFSDCLIELGTEELPPKALKILMQDFSALMSKALEDSGLTPPSVETFATPRRLALLFRDIPLRQPDQSIAKRGPALKAAYDVDGNPTRAAQGFANSCGVKVEQLVQRKTDKGAWLYFENTEPGLNLAELLPDMLNQALMRLPIPKRMRWGDGDAEFVRPLRWLVIMIGDSLVEASIFGIDAATYSYGHRFLAPGKIEIARAGEYEITLLSQGLVMSHFEKRQDTIRNLVEKTAARLGGIAQIEDTLLEEVTSLVEYPVAIDGEFDAEFLQVPQEVLVMTMQDNQKYFAVFDKTQKLMPYFITISNIDSKRPEVVACGNERVIRPRFADAQFFFQQDRKQALSTLRSRLDRVIFQEQLGSIGDKVERIVILACSIGTQIDADTGLVQQAAQLCKCDLMTEMVGEFPKLQGVMGRYYAERDHSPQLVSAAIEQHYWPKYAGDELPRSNVAQCLALADRLDSMVGIFALGQKPSGVKDPFALRRAALAVVRILIEQNLSLDIHKLCQLAAQGLSDKVEADTVVDEVVDYILDRLKSYYQEQGIVYDIVDAVLAVKPMLLHDCDQRVQALNQFQSHAAASALAAANKRISNILKKQALAELPPINPALLSEDAEKQLCDQIEKLHDKAADLFTKGCYLQGLELLAQLRPAVDKFFDDVMVMVDDPAIKNNRLALLDQLLRCFRQVADFSRIQS